MKKFRQKTKNTNKVTFRREMMGFLFISPWLVGLALFFITPMINTIIYSFSTVTIWDSGLGVSVVNAGLENYIYAFTKDVQFPQLLSQSVNGLIDIPLIVIFSLFAAMLIHKKFFGRSLIRLIFFLPVIYGTGIIIKFMQYDVFFSVFQNRVSFLSGDNALMQMLSNMDLRRLIEEIARQFPFVNYILGAVSRIFGIINRSGVQILIFLAGLNTIPQEYYEAGTIDGATGWDNFWQITLPNVSSFLIMNAVYSLIDSFLRVEDTLYATNLFLYITNVTFTQYRFGVGAAMSMVSFLTIGLLVGAVAFIIKLMMREKPNARY